MQRYAHCGVLFHFFEGWSAALVNFPARLEQIALFLSTCKQALDFTPWFFFKVDFAISRQQNHIVFVNWLVIIHPVGSALLPLINLSEVKTLGSISNDDGNGNENVISNHKFSLL